MESGGGGGKMREGRRMETVGAKTRRVDEATIQPLRKGLKEERWRDAVEKNGSGTSPFKACFVRPNAANSQSERGLGKRKKKKNNSPK